MTKGVPSGPRTCVRCGNQYQPTSGSQRYCVSCKPIMRKVYASEWSRRNPNRRKQITKRAEDKNPERTRQLKKYNFYRWKDLVVRQVMERYSNGPPKCACCGESERDFLSIDHVDGHGNEHRRRTFGRHQGGWQLYAWLIRQGFPAGFQVLCFNCNMSKAKHGRCAHVAKPTPPQPPLDMKPLHRTPGLKPTGDEVTLVKWNPKMKHEGQAFKGSSEAGENPAERHEVPQRDPKELSIL